jgi:Tol biopolymer transport system component
MWRVIVAAVVIGLVVCPMNAMGTVPGRNGRIAFSTGGIVLTVRPDGSGVKVVTAGSAPVWSPNGKRIAYVWSNSVYTISAAGGGKRERRLVIADARSPTWSPSGQRLAVVRRSGIWLVGQDGRNPRRLTAAAPGYPSKLDWSPNGKRIAFSYQRAIVAVRVRDGTLTTLRRPRPTVTSADGGWCEVIGLYAPTWAPDGSRLAFQTVSTCESPGYNPSTFSYIEIVDADSGAYLAGIDGTFGSPYDFGAVLPSWAPDGHALAFLDDVSDSEAAIVLSVYDLDNRATYPVRRLPVKKSSVVARPEWQRLAPRTDR